MKLFLLALILPLAGAINCDADEDLSDATEYSYTLPVSAKDLSYWRTYHLNFEVYGSFSSDDVSDATVSAGYYTEDGNLVYGVSIDCSTSTWKSTVSAKPIGISTPWQNGSVTCEAGNWDLWLKVQQPFLMNWIFNGSPLQEEVTEDHKLNRGKYPHFITINRERAVKVPTKFGAQKGRTYKVETSAALSRFTFGECISYPSDLNCTEASAWVLGRSKLKSGLGQLGANTIMWQPSCIDSGNFQHIQTNVHPDRKVTDVQSPYCCCVDMTTGKVYDDDKDTYCMQLSGNYDECLEVCGVSYDSSLYAETDDLYRVFKNYYGTEVNTQ